MLNVLRMIENYIFDYEEKNPEVSKCSQRKTNPPNPL